ncbi:MAG: acyl-CoA dehydrogenase family protein, partial [Gemmatimonadota bacterium]
AARALVERAAADPSDDAAAAMAKLAAGAAAMRVTTEAVQVFGGYGYMKDYPVEKLMRDAKAMDIVHGTSEMQRLRIAAALYAD